MSEQNKKAALGFIEAFGRGDTEASAPFLDPEASTFAKGYGKFAGERKYEMIVGTIGALKLLTPTGLNPSMKSVTAEGDRVVVEWEGNAKTSDGQTYNNQYCMVFTMRNGRILKVNEYFCTKLADEVLWPLVDKLMNQPSAE